MSRGQEGGGLEPTVIVQAFNQQQYFDKQHYVMKTCCLVFIHIEIHIFLNKICTWMLMEMVGYYAPLCPKSLFCSALGIQCLLP